MSGSTSTRKMHRLRSSSAARARARTRPSASASANASPATSEGEASGEEEKEAPSPPRASRYVTQEELYREIDRARGPSTELLWVCIAAAILAVYYSMYLANNRRY